MPQRREDRDVELSFINQRFELTSLLFSNHQIIPRSALTSFCRVKNIKSSGAMHVAGGYKLWSCLAGFHQKRHDPPESVTSGRSLGFVRSSRCGGGGGDMQTRLPFMVLHHDQIRRTLLQQDSAASNVSGHCRNVQCCPSTGILSSLPQRD
jgi:hypothetical protein